MGSSKIQESTLHFQVPSACFLQISRRRPRSDTDAPRESREAQFVGSDQKSQVARPGHFHFDRAPCNREVGLRQEAGHGMAKESLAVRELVIGQKDKCIGGIERHPRVDAGGARRCSPIRVGLAHRRLGCRQIDRGRGREARPANEQGGDGQKCKECQQPIFHSLFPDADALR